MTEQEDNLMPDLSDEVEYGLSELQENTSREVETSNFQSSYSYGVRKKNQTSNRRREDDRKYRFEIMSEVEQEGETQSENRQDSHQSGSLMSHDSDRSDVDESFDERDNGARPVAKYQSNEMAARAESATQIARMKNSFLMDPDEVQEEKLVSPNTINSPVSNAFRELRRNVFEYTGKSNPIVLVTGVTKDVGSSFTAKNLAAAIALDEVSTALFVDCNIRLSKTSDDENVGLTDFLESNSIEESAIIQHTGIPRLRKIGPGQQRELIGEYFSSPRIKYLFNNIATRYPDRSIVIDGPPASTDTAILTDLCDAVLLVVAYGKSTERQVAKAVAQLGRDKIMGVVFNDQPFVPEYQW